MSLESLFHVTVLSNFARAYDRYEGAYRKDRIAESSFPDRFFLLRRDELGVGIEKASRLLRKLALEGDELIALETAVASSALHPNERTGLGRFIGSSALPVVGVHRVSAEGALCAATIEELGARSLRVLHPRLRPYPTLVPRSVSLLPIGRGCQARCAFCFSEASISADGRAARSAPGTIDRWLDRAAAAGAERAVITGGGEPGLLRFELLVDLVLRCAARFPKVVLISNGVFLAEQAERLVGRRVHQGGPQTGHHGEPPPHAQRAHVRDREAHPGGPGSGMGDEGRREVHALHVEAARPQLGAERPGRTADVEERATFGPRQAGDRADHRRPRREDPIPHLGMRVQKRPQQRGPFAHRYLRFLDAPLRAFFFAGDFFAGDFFTGDFLAAGFFRVAAFALIALCFCAARTF